MAMHRFSWTFPAGRPGAQLLLLRVAAATTLAAQVGLAEVSPRAAVAALLASAALVIGFLTPVGGALAVVYESAAYVLARPLASGDIPSACCQLWVAVTVVAIAMLGPGAFSIDARLFGSRSSK